MTVKWRPMIQYGISPTGEYILSRDGKEILCGSEHELVKYIHQNHCYSVDHALRYEGYSIEPK